MQYLRTCIYNFSSRPKVLRVIQDQRDLTLKQKFTNLIEMREPAANLFDENETYVLSAKFDQQFKCDQVLLRYNFVLLNCWLLLDRCRAENLHFIRSYRLRRSLERILFIYMKDSVYQFKDYFDRDVYHELRRLQRTIFYALDDYYIYKFAQKPLDQIVEQDILLGESLKSVPEYIESHRAYLKTLTINEILKFEVKWGL